MLKRIPTLLSAALLLQACASGVPGVIEQPKISIQNISLQDISLTQGTALVTLNVANPNAFPIPLQGIQYGLSLNGHPVASGDQNARHEHWRTSGNADQYPGQVGFHAIAATCARKR